MIVYGSKMYFKKNVVNSFGSCQHCGNYGKQTSYQAKKMGHFYFIPLIPLGGRSQVLNECSSCDMGAQISMNDLEPRLEVLREQFKSWITEIQDGHTEITPDGAQEPINAGVLIAGIIEDLYCLNEIQDVEMISQILASAQMDYEDNLVKGKWHELQGELEQASASYHLAHTSNPDDPVALYQKGCTDIKIGDAIAAEDAFGKYMTLEPEDLSPLVELATLYENNKDFTNIVRTYDKIYTLNPDMVSEKAMKKVYKKACKKSGQPGQFLDQM